jgi:hypothetical protein
VDRNKILLRKENLKKTITKDEEQALKNLVDSTKFYKESLERCEHAFAEIISEEVTDDYGAAWTFDFLYNNHPESLEEFLEKHKIEVT